MTASPCPSETELLALLEGNLAPEDESRLLQHLDTCVACQKTVEQDTAGISVPDQLAETRQSQSDPDYRELVDRIKSPEWAPPPFANEGFDPRKSWQNESFELISELGRGGMGVVYLAHEKSLDRKVAVKFLTPQLASQPGAKQRFVREAKAAAAIRDSGAITIHGVSEGSPPFIVMEYVEGETLQERMERKPFTVEETIDIAKQIARVLHQAHSINVLHRDIKPANVLLDSHSQEAKLTDFGLAQIAGESKLTQSGMLIGTPAYMAPELLELREDVDGRADLYSLGVLLYAMLTGRSPFESGSILSTIRNVAALSPPSISEVRSDVPTWLTSLILDLLEKEPENRPDNANQVLQRLESRQIVTANPQNVSQPTEKGNLPWPLIGGGLVAVLLLLIAGSWMNSSNVQPFISRTDDETFQFDSLAEALAESPDGATIEIQSDGPFLLQETRLSKELSMVAAPGVQPSIVFDSANSYEGAMLTTNSSLTLEGLELSYVAEDGNDEAFALVRLDGGNLIVRNSRMTFSGEEGCCISADLDQESNLQLSESVISAWPGESIQLIFRETASVLMENCTITGTTCFDVESFGEGEIELFDCRLVGENFLITNDEEEEADGQIVLQATNNQIHLFESFADIGHDEDDDEFEPRVEVMGHDNSIVLPSEEAEHLSVHISEVGALVKSVFSHPASVILDMIRQPEDLHLDSFTHSIEDD